MHEGASVTGVISMPQVIRMPLQNGECPVDLFQQNYPRQFVRQRHTAERNRMLRRVAS
jgi:hypothetical protein